MVLWSGPTLVQRGTWTLLGGADSFVENYQEHSPSLAFVLYL